jgi:cyclic 2,3-diphosphoglycerate synthase
VFEHGPGEHLAASAGSLPSEAGSAGRRRKAARGVRAVALIDGEHYAPVVRDALAAMPHDVVAAVLVGGSEKLRGGEDYGVPLAGGLDEAIASYTPELVVDLSDEPVLGPVERMIFASRVLAHGLPYEGADFRFDAPAFEPVDVPALAVVGTGKRVGKTAVTGHAARLLAAEWRLVVVAMGRGGPPEPEVVRVPPTVEALVSLSRAGRHAASDHLETAALAGVETVGCWRCGGGLAGAVAISNVHEGARVAAALDPALVVFDGSGAAFPPVAAARRVLVVGSHQDPAVAFGYLNTYRLLLADLVVLTMAERGSGYERMRDRALDSVREGVPVVPTVLRPTPAEPVAGRRVAFFCTAPVAAQPILADHLRDAHGADVVHVSGALADRRRLVEELPGIDADVFLVELKAAAVDIVVEEALERGVDVVLASNDVVALPGAGDLDAELRRLAAEVVAG